jgi:hypothetical protein
VVPVAELVWLTDRDEDRADNHFAGCDRASYQKVDAIIFPFRDFDGPGSKVSDIDAPSASEGFQHLRRDVAPCGSVPKGLIICAITPMPV